ncbi:MAG: hypothetical protein IT317_00240 [Anaerolineales bacterium]|nr:hypothetical protein [Anaerolineales bacterium]
MKALRTAQLVGGLLMASLACNLGTPGPATPPNTSTSVAPAPTATLGAVAETPSPSASATPGAAGEVSASASSAAAVAVTWSAVAGATDYQLEARYAEGDYFAVATLPGDQTSYAHYVLPGSPTLTYRVTALTSNEPILVGTAPVSPPAALPNPLLVQPMEFVPALDAIPTLDPNNPQLPDLDALFKPIGVQQVVGPEGGTVVVTSPDATVYTLEVPAGAVDQSLLFGLTPIEKVQGLPLGGGLLGAVQVSPRLAFGLPLTLTVQLPAGRALPTPQTVGFGVYDEFYLLPMTVTAEDSAAMLLFEGGVYGLGAATADDLARQAARLPTDSQAQVAQLMALLTAARADAAGMLDQILAGLEAQVTRLAPPINSAARAAGPARPNGQAPVNPVGDLWNALNSANLYFNERYSGPGRIADITGSDDARHNRMIDDLAKWIKVFVDEAKEKCITQDDLLISEIIRRFQAPREIFWIRLWARYQALYGGLNNAKPCAFEFSVTSAIYSVDELGNYSDVKVHTETPMILTLGVRNNRIVLQGHGPLVYDRYLLYDSICPPVTDIKPYPATALAVTDLTPVFDSEGHVKDFVLQGVKPGMGASGIGVNANVPGVPPDACRIISVTGTSLPDLWATGFTLAQLYPFGHFIISGDEAQVVATNTITDHKVRNITENSTFVLTISKH